MKCVAPDLGITLASLAALEDIAEIDTEKTPNPSPIPIPVYEVIKELITAPNRGNL
jgi:hypothetical protein